MTPERQVSLEGAIAPLPQPLDHEERVQALNLFDSIINDFEPSQTTETRLKPVTLIRLMKEEVSDKDGFLRLFFPFIEHYLDGGSNDTQPNFSHIISRLGSFTNWAAKDKSTLGESLTHFTNYLVDNFFLPLKTLAAKTPQPTPAALSRSQLSEAGIGTPQRISTLRRECLKRDRHRCVITRKFDFQEAEDRLVKDGSDFKDDDGNSLLSESDSMTYLEVAHIIPHALMSLTNVGREQKLAEPKQIARKILDMFDPTAIPLISGPDVDRPKNALTLTKDLHTLFGRFEITFEHIEGLTYKIDYTKPDRVLRIVPLPVTRELHITPNRDVDRPSVDLLKVHRAIAKILHLSAAGEFIDKCIRDMQEIEEGQVDPNGSSRIDDYVRFKLGGNPREMSVH